MAGGCPSARIRRNYHARPLDRQDAATARSEFRDPWRVWQPVAAGLGRMAAGCHGPPGRRTCVGKAAASGHLDGRDAGDCVRVNPLATTSATGSRKRRGLLRLRRAMLSPLALGNPEQSFSDPTTAPTSAGGVIALPPNPIVRSPAWRAALLATERPRRASRWVWPPILREQPGSTAAWAPTSRPLCTTCNTRFAGADATALVLAGCRLQGLSRGHGDICGNSLLWEVHVTNDRTIGMRPNHRYRRHCHRLPVRERQEELPSVRDMRVASLPSMV